jgi:hypothetical protein
MVTQLQLSQMATSMNVRLNKDRESVEELIGL